MGCTPSRPSPSSVETELRPVRHSRQWTPPGQPVIINPTIDRPHYTERVPIPELNSYGGEIHRPQPQMDRKTMILALTSTAKYLRDRGSNLTIVTVGGALNVVLLKSRKTSDDVDFFAHPMSAQEARLIEEAAKNVSYQSEGRIGSDWLSNRVINLIPRDLRRRLAERALEQNTVVFENPGLKVLAAPWSFSFASKIDRMFLNPKKGPVENDTTDAAHYLRRYIETHHNRLVPMRIIQQWSTTYGVEAPYHIVKKVNAEYRRLYGHDGITGLEGAGRNLRNDRRRR